MEPFNNITGETHVAPITIDWQKIAHLRSIIANDWQVQICAQSMATVLLSLILRPDDAGFHYLRYFYFQFFWTMFLFKIVMIVEET